MIPLRRMLPVLGVILFSSMSSGQTPEMIAEVEARLHALRTAAPLILPGPAASTAIEEAAADALAARIDKHLEVFWAKNKIRPTDPADDAEFLRRIYLDLV